MIDRRIRRRLEQVGSRFRKKRLWTTLAVGWSLAAVVGLASLGLNWGFGWWYSPWMVPLLVVAALIVPVLCFWIARRSARDLQWIAARIEAEYPELNSRLLAAAEQEPELPGGCFGYLQESVIREALDHGRKRDWKRTVTARRLFWVQAGSFASLVVLAVVITGLYVKGEPQLAQQSSDLLNVQVVSRNAAFQVTIEPGDKDIERGASLLVLARFTGPLPPDVTLVYEDDSGASQQLPMSKSLDDPVFAGRIAAVERELTYHVAFANQQSESYRVRVFEYPQLKRADAKLVFPEYTSMKEIIVEDVRRITAVEGTQLTLTCLLNKPVAQANLVGEDGESLALSADDEQPGVYVVRMTLTESRRFKLRLVDEEARTNKHPPKFVINVTPNRRPDLKLARPSRDVQVSPLEELRLKANVWDDFGLSRFGLTYSLAGEPPHEIAIGRSAAGKKRLDLDHLLSFESLEA